jgi:pimeloyl-ACP methyl ester carboxylesterase
MHGNKDKICSFDLAEQMKAGIANSYIIAFENSGHSMFLEETQKFNSELIKFAKENYKDDRSYINQIEVKIAND